MAQSIAGFAIHQIGIFYSFILVASFLFIGFSFLLLISEKPIMYKSKGESVVKSLKEGLVFVFQNKTILNALSLDMFAVLFGGCVALLPVFAQDILKVGSEGFGLLRAAPAIGGLITMVVAMFLPLNHNAGKKVLIAVFLFGVFNILFGLSTNFYLSIIMLFMSGVADGISVVLRQTILQIYTPDEMRGRVSSVNSIFVGSSNELGAFESGLFSKWFGVVNAVVVGGIITILVVFYTAIKAPKFRNLQIEN
ncbi:MAG: MFS transporter [Ottowia sp.]